MMKPRSLTGLLLCLAAAAQAYPRSDLPSAKFQHKDWELACDNTRTCRAAGYQPEDQDAPYASVLLTRRAGPNETVQARLRLAEDPDHPAPAVVTMSIGGKSYGTVRIDADTSTGTLSASQARALATAVLKDDAITWRAGSTTWTISTAGANAVLLRMDEFQGRIDTPDALARKGKKPATSVLPALPAPIVQAASLPRSGTDVAPFTAQQERALLAALRTTVPDDDCEELAKDGKFEVQRLSGDKLLVSHACWQGAYNAGDGYWVINEQAPYSPVLVTTSASGYVDGVIEAVQRGRGIGDCMAKLAWTWDGRSFAQTLDATTGMCRQIAAGGAWDLPTLVAEVRRKK